jgi:prepilin-type N-terminal cleavage/methylation domain-containing protein
MTQNYTGMRKGISLVEMMIAIILFAALSTIGLKYYKNYINTDLQAMKARNAAAMEEASQLTAAYKLYTTQFGALTTIDELNATATQIMTAIPLKITEMTSAGWTYSTDINGTGKKGFSMVLDANTTLTSDEQYCALWNKEFNSSVELNVSNGQSFGTFAGMSATLTSFCADDGAGAGHTVYVIMP